VFRGLKDGEWLGWGPMYHWTDSKIRIHAFYCMLGISLLQYLHRQSQNVWPGLSVEQFLEELRQIQQFVLLYPPLGDKGPNRVATVLSKQTLAQQALAESIGCGYFGTTRNQRRISSLGGCIASGGVAKTGDIGISPVFYESRRAGGAGLDW
jgi:hypothetical protein